MDNIKRNVETSFKEYKYTKETLKSDVKYAIYCIIVVAILSFIKNMS